MRLSILAERPTTRIEGTPTRATAPWDIHTVSQVTWHFTRLSHWGISADQSSKWQKSRCNLAKAKNTGQFKRETLSLCQGSAPFIFSSASIQVIPHLSVHPREILVPDIIAYSANECRTLTRSILTRKRLLKAASYFQIRLPIFHLVASALVTTATNLHMTFTRTMWRSRPSISQLFHDTPITCPLVLSPHRQPHTSQYPPGATGRHSPPDNPEQVRDHHTSRDKLPSQPDYPRRLVLLAVALPLP
jgi:hypothetical protein